MRSLLIKNHSETLRKSYSDILCTILETLSTQETPLFEKNRKNWKNGPCAPKKGDSYSACFIEHLLASLVSKQKKSSKNNIF